MFYKSPKTNKNGFKTFITNQTGLIAIMAAVGALIGYRISFRSLNLGIGTVDNDNSMMFAILVQIFELIGISKIIMGEKSDDPTEIAVEWFWKIMTGIILALDLMATFIGFGDTRFGLPTDTFARYLSIGLRGSVSILASTVPELMTMEAFFRGSKSWKKIFGGAPQEEKKDKEPSEPAHQPARPSFQPADYGSLPPRPTRPAKQGFRWQFKGNSWNEVPIRGAPGPSVFRGAPQGPPPYPTATKGDPPGEPDPHP